MLHLFVCVCYKSVYSVCFYAKDRFRESVGVKVVKALKKEDEGVTHAAIDMVCALMHPMHDNYDLRQEQLNKSSLLSSSKFLENLLTMWISHLVSLKEYWNN
jgi:DnaJ family protein C protein 13